MLQLRNYVTSARSVGAGERHTRPTALAERRSPLRPQFLPGWRKSIPSSGSKQPAKIEPKAGASVSVWTSRVATLLAASSNLNLLSDDDRASLQTIRSTAQRNSATAARILLRLALSLSADRRLAPNEWRFERTAFGKPFVRENNEALDFSVSHADQVVMVAIGRDIKLGLDVESVDQPLEDTLVSHFCHVTEAHSLQSLPAPQRLRRFIQLWTQKEAYSKMLGLGHSLEFRSFSLQNIQESTDHPSRMIVEEFYFPLEQSLYHAALVIDRKAQRRPIDIRLMTASLPGRAACALSPPPLTTLS